MPKPKLNHKGSGQAPAGAISSLVAQVLANENWPGGSIWEKLSEGEKLWLENELAKTLCSLINKNYDLKVVLSYVFLRGSAILALLEGFYLEGGIHRWDPVPNWLLEYRARRPPESRGECSRISIVVPTRLNRETEAFRRTLSAVSRVGKVFLVGHFERILRLQYNNVVVYNIEGRDSPAISRNIGIDLATDWRADTVIFLDDDILLDNRDENAIKTLSREACGRGISHPRAMSTALTPFDSFHDYEGTLNGMYYGDKSRLLYATTFAVAVDSQLLTTGLRFNPEFRTSAGEDIDFSLNAIRLGGYIIPVDDIILYHDYNYNNIYSINKFLSRFKRYGIGNAKLIQLHPYYYNTLRDSITRRTSGKLCDCMADFYNYIIIKYHDIVNRFNLGSCRGGAE